MKSMPPSYCPYCEEKLAAKKYHPYCSHWCKEKSNG